MKQKRFLSMLVLLAAVVTGAWAQDPAKYKITVAEGTEDAENWSVPAEAAAGSPVTATYEGKKKVKSVKAVKKAPKPDLLAGVFSVSASKKVNFSKGNLSYASSKWSFFDNQYDYYRSYSADAWDHFGWSTSANTYGMNTSTDDNNYSGDFVDWGATMGTGWFTLSKDEWTYLLNTRNASTVNGTENGRYAKAEVNGVMGVILFPDTYTHPDGVTAPVGVNATGNTGWNGNSYSSADWTKMESAGCVFLPAAGGRDGSTVNLPGWYGYYWSATPSGTGSAYYVSLTSSSLQLYSYNRYNGYSVRLVQANNPYANAQLGDLFYSDGTFSSTLVAGKTPIGVIAYLDQEGTDDDEICEKSNGAGHGLVLCLKDAASAIAWSTEISAFEFDEDAKVADVNALKRTTNVSGYTNTKTLAEKTDAATKYKAAYAAKSYTGLTAPTGTTGWFLPSAQQWVKMQTGLGALEESSITWDSSFDNNHEGADKWEAALSKAGSGNYDSMTSAYLYYWSSSEYSAGGAVNLNVCATGTGYGYGFSWYYNGKGEGGTYSYFRVRPVLAF